MKEQNTQTEVRLPEQGGHDFNKSEDCAYGCGCFKPGSLLAHIPDKSAKPDDFCRRNYAWRIDQLESKIEELQMKVRSSVLVE